MDPRMLNFLTTSERADSLIILFQMKELRPFLTLSDATQFWFWEQKKILDQELTKT